MCKKAKKPKKKRAVRPVKKPVKLLPKSKRRPFIDGEI